MATEIKLPRLGQGMESGTIVKWLKSEGERVEKGEPLYELDTDKVTQEVEADASGVLLKIAVAEGEVPVGRTIAVIGEQGEALPAEPTGTGSANGGAAARVAETGEEEGSRAPARDDERRHGGGASAGATRLDRPEVDTGGGRVKASPLARRIARERGIDLAAVAGTGPEGRVVAEDVERSAAGAVPIPAVALPRGPEPQGEEVQFEELSSMRKTIGQRHSTKTMDLFCCAANRGGCACRWSGCCAP